MVLIVAKRRIEAEIVAKDNASGVFQKVKSNASSMASSIMKSLGGAVTTMEKFEKSLHSYNNSMHRVNRVISNVARTAGDSIYNFTKDAINNFSALEQQHAKTMGAMATEYGKTTEAQKKFLDDSERLKQQAIQLGTTGPNGRGALFTTTDVAYAQTALVKAGMSADDLLGSNALESILKFAGGNDLSIDTATQFAVNLGTIFDKPVEQWDDMLDMVTKAADISVIDVEDIMDSLTYTGGIASGLGRDLEEVLGVISVMGQAGLRGRVAGTGLQAFFTRILSAGELTDTQIGSAPTDYVGQMYNAFTAEAVNADGSFKAMDEVAELLDTAMGTLNDQEQAWFAKKLFGLYQMKAAYAISGAVGGDVNIITDFINQIENQSKGTNDIKYELMQASQYGKIESLKNAWEGIKTDIGDKFSPVISTLADELFNFLDNDGNYDINWDKLRKSFSESGNLIGEKYGERLGQAIEDFGNVGINAVMIGEALMPQIGGTISGIGKLLNGDISGAIDDFSRGVKDTNDNIDGLPEELRGVANAAQAVVSLFTAIAGINLVTAIAEPILKAVNTLFGKPIKAITAKVTSTKATVAATNTIVNANYVQVNSSSSTIQTGASTINIGSIPLMNVTASVVNVYGGGGNPTNPTNPTTPTLPSAPTTPLLPAVGGGLLGYAGGKLLPQLSGGSSVSGLLTDGGAAGIGAGAGKTITMYNIGGQWMTKGQIAKMIAGKAALGALAVTAGIASIDLLGSPGLLWSEDKRVQSGSDWIDKYIAEGKTSDDDINKLSKDSFVHNWAQTQSGYDGNNKYSIVEAEVRGRSLAREEMLAYYKTGAGAEILDELFTAQIEENGKITEEFLTSITQWTKDGYTYTGSNEDIKEILNFMYANFGEDFKASKNYTDRFNDAAINKFLKGDPQLNAFEVSTTTSDLLETVNEAVSKLESPITNVYVTTNVDKSGNATTTVDVNNMSRQVARRASQYGQVAMPY